MQSSQRHMATSLPRRCSLTRCSPLRVWQLWQYIDCPFVVVLTVKYLPHRYQHPCCAARSVAIWMRADPSPADTRPHVVDTAFLSRLARVAEWAQAVDDIAVCRYMPDWLYTMALDVGFYYLDLALRYRDEVGTTGAALAALAVLCPVIRWRKHRFKDRAQLERVRLYIVRTYHPIVFFFHVSHLLAHQNGISSSGTGGRCMDFASVMLLTPCYKQFPEFIDALADFFVAAYFSHVLCLLDKPLVMLCTYFLPGQLWLPTKIAADTIPWIDAIFSSPLYLSTLAFKTTF